MRKGLEKEIIAMFAILVLLAALIYIVKNALNV